MSIYGKQKPVTITYSNDFKYISEIMKSLSKKEIDLMDGWSNEPSSHTVFREVLLIDEKPVAFVEIDQFKSNPKANAKDYEGFIGLACKSSPEYRRKGYTSMLLERAIKWAKRNKTISRLVYIVREENVPSKNLALKFGFKSSKTKMNPGWLELYLEV